jgi:DNA (cytosine-5)-methyltransferase 1
MTHGSLFAGIGGFDLGFERAGIKTVWQVEIDPFCRKVLEKHWPKVLRYDDIRECCGSLLRQDTDSMRCAECGRLYWLPYADIISGGFPCQDISYCGYGEGLDGERSGLWWEQHRIIRELRPQLALVENVSALLGRGFGRVVGSLAEIGYDCEWDCFPASAFGAYHDRDRVFIVAHRKEGNGFPHDLLEAGEEWRASFQSRRLHSMAVATRAERENSRLEHEPGLARMVSRIPDQVQRLEALGNICIPQIAEWIGRRILACELGIHQS